MLQRSKWIVGTLLIFIIIAGCELASPKDPIIVPKVEDEFYIDLWERLDGTSGRNLIVKIESIKNEDCLNYRMDYFFSRTGNRLKISLNNIIKPTDCVPGEAPVKADVDAGSLPSGTYNFDIDFKSLVENKGLLSVNSESYLLDMKSEDGIVLLREELLRVPDNTIWGYVTFQQGQDEAAANDFLTDVQALGKAPTYRSGYYGHFTISPLDGKVFVDQQPTTSNIKTFLLEYTDNDTVLKNLLDEYRQSYNNRLTIRLINSKGKVF